MTQTEDERIEWQAGPLSVTIGVDIHGVPRLYSIRPAGSPAIEPPEPHNPTLPLTEIRLAGEQNVVRPGTGKRAMGTYLGRRLQYVRHAQSQYGVTKALEVESHDAETGITVINNFTQFGEAPVLRSETTVRNDGHRPRTVHAVSSLSIGAISPGCTRWWEEHRLRYANSSWFREAQWVDCSFPDVGIDHINARKYGEKCSHSFFDICNIGSLSSDGHLPMGGIERTDGRGTWMWTIEHNGGWRWEVGEFEEKLYVVAGGPSEMYHRWTKPLAPGETFVSVPVALAVVNGPAESAFQALTSYRRLIRRHHADNEHLSIIFNDYMNCLNGDPTTEKVVALIEPAARAGAEYFCVDCGWYSDDAGWWSSVGAWKESKLRFPEGLAYVMDKIRAAGLKPGLWIEPEVMGVECPAVSELPPEAYFQRDGEMVVEMERYQLDYRHPAVRERMDRIIDRLVADYGICYFKFDYNIDITAHTDISCASPGDGALEHNRAYLTWVRGVFDRHPNLVIETCSSGGQRLDGALLALHPLQSTSDQQDPVPYAAISANIPTAVTPEQSASWAYPQPEWSDELIAFTVVNTLLGRIHLSGRVDLLSERQHALVTEGMTAYKSIRGDLRTALPFWPLGLAGWRSEWVALGMACADGRTCYVSVWRRWGENKRCELPVRRLKGRRVEVECLYPTRMEIQAVWNEEAGSVVVELPSAPCARLLRVSV